MAEKLREVIGRRMRELGLNYEDLARRAGYTGVYISKIAQGKVVPSDEVIVKLAETLELDLSRLILLAHYEKAPGPVKEIFQRLSGHRAAEFLGEGTELDNVEAWSLLAGRAVPVAGMVQAGAFMPSEDGGFPPGMADGFVYTDRKGRNLFGARVVNDSMEPEFKEGDILIVNPNLEAQNGDYVIAKLKHENEATFKKLVLVSRGPGNNERLVILRPLNPRYQDIVVEDPANLEIVGKVVERKTLF